MRVKLFLYSQTKGLSLLELVLVLGIVGILIWCAMPSFSLNDQVCFYELRSRLQKANADFAKLYTRHILYAKALEHSLILQELTQKSNPHCFFTQNKKGLLAQIGLKTLQFTMDPQDFRAKPRIYCSTSNELCRRFWGRTLKK